MTLIEELQNGGNAALEFKEASPKDSLKFTKTMRNACANAFAQSMLESAKGKLIAAANEGGMATGTSSELPAVMLDKLGDFLAEDPFGNIEKVDKFCAYLEKNGPAALHVADGKDVDLNRLFKQVVG